MKVDWTNGHHLDGPGFTQWCERELIVLADGSLDKQLGESQARLYRDWRRGKRRVEVWSADALLTARGRHLREIPDRLWVEEPTVGVLTGLLRARPIKAIARETGCAPSHVRYWRDRVLGEELTDFHCLMAEPSKGERASFSPSTFKEEEVSASPGLGLNKRIERVAA